MGRFFIPLGLLLALGAVLAVGLTLNPLLVPSPLIEQRAPAFTLPQLHEPEKLLSSETMRGQVVVLNIWASWCVACRQEHPLLLELVRAGQVRLYGLNYKDRREDALRWLDYYGDPYQVSAADVAGKVGIDFGVSGIPETFIIDRQGVIRHKHIGPITEQDWRDTIQPLLQRLENEATT